MAQLVSVANVAEPFAPWDAPESSTEGASSSPPPTQSSADLPPPLSGDDSFSELPLLAPDAISGPSPPLLASDASVQPALPPLVADTDAGPPPLASEQPSAMSQLPSLAPDDDDPYAMYTTSTPATAGFAGAGAGLPPALVPDTTRAQPPPLAPAYGAGSAGHAYPATGSGHGDADDDDDDDDLWDMSKRVDDVLGLDLDFGRPSASQPAAAASFAESGGSWSPRRSKRPNLWQKSSAAQPGFAPPSTASYAAPTTTAAYAPPPASNFGVTAPASFAAPPPAVSSMGSLASSQPWQAPAASSASWTAHNGGGRPPPVSAPDELHDIHDLINIDDLTGDYVPPASASSRMEARSWLSQPAAQQPSLPPHLQHQQQAVLTPQHMQPGGGHAPPSSLASAPGAPPPASSDNSGIGAMIKADMREERRLRTITVHNIATAVGSGGGGGKKYT